jgi:hypothetical protein
MIDTVIDTLISGSNGESLVSFGEVPVEINDPSIKVDEGQQQVVIDQTAVEQGTQSDEPDTEFGMIAKEYKERGIIDDEFAIQKGFSYEQLAEAVEKSLVKKTEDAIRQKVYEELQQDGITIDVIEQTRLNNAGISQNEVSFANDLYALATVDLSRMDREEADKELFAWTKLRYMHRGYEADDAENAASRDIDEDPRTAAERNKAFFSEQYNAMRSNLESKIESKKKADAEAAAADRARVERIIESGTIAGEKFSPDDISKIKKAFFDQTETVKVDGKYYKVTLLQKRMIEEKKDMEKQLLRQAQMVLGITPATERINGINEGTSNVAKSFLESRKSAGYTYEPSGSRGEINFEF